MTQSLRKSHYNLRIKLNPITPDASKVKKPYVTYTEKLKLNSENYKQFRIMDALRCKLARMNRTPEQIKHQNETSRIRMQRYREKKGNDKNNSNSKPKRPLTRKEKEKMREYWKIKKREERTKMSVQKKRRILEKQRKYYHTKVKKQFTSNSTEFKDNQVTPIQTTLLNSPVPMSEPSPYKLQSSKNKALYRTKCRLPKSPRKFASVIASLIKKATPRKKKALANIGINNDFKIQRQLKFYTCAIDSVKETICHLKSKHCKKNNKQTRTIAKCFGVLKKYRLINAISRNTGLNRTTMRRVLKGQLTVSRRSNTLNKSTIDLVIEFYKNISIVLPTKKTVSKKTLIQKSVLDRTLKLIFELFKKKNTDIKISYSTFCKLRPKTVLTMKQMKYNQCLCEYCENIKLKLKCWNKFWKKIKQEDVIQNKDDVLAITLCPSETEFSKLTCLQRNCKKCGIFKIEAKVKELLTEFANKTVKWWRWEMIETSKIKDGKKCFKKGLQEKTDTFNIFFKEFLAEIAPFSMHLFNAKWQSKVFINLRKNIPENWVIIIMDFAENFLCNYQDEIQNAYWYHEQVTLHIVVAYYKCLKCQNDTVIEALIFISEDNIHDSHAAHHYLTLSNKHLINRGIKIAHQSQWSDGSTAQYKSKTPFMDISHAENDFGFSVDRNYFGSRHGKGPCDGAGGIVKQGVSSAIKSRRAIIRNAFDMFQYCQKNMSKEQKDTCSHSLRTFFFVKENQIRHDRPERSAVTVQGTRLLHSVKSLKKSKVIATRNLSCFCTGCITDIGGNCDNQDYVSNWNNVTIQSISLKDSKNSEKKPCKFFEDDLSKDINDKSNASFNDELAQEELDNLEKMLNQEQKSLQPIIIDNFYIVRWGPEEKLFVAQVQDFDETNQQVLIKFMEGSHNFYSWPSSEDISWEPVASVLKNIKPPELDLKKSTNRKQIYCVFDI